MPKIDPCKLLEIAEKSITFKPYVPKLKDPFKILVATIISARTKEEVTEEVSERLFSRIKRPEDLLKISIDELEKLLYPAGFYKTKAKRLKQLVEVLVKNFRGKVPDNLEDLLSLPSVGIKTANLVLSEAFGKPAICVDTHVHRVFNRLGIVDTKTPEETERELRKIFPKECWSKINKIFVGFGREICRPRSPRCDICPLREYCNFFKQNVKKKYK